jgi:hypothetical protein
VLPIIFFFSSPGMVLADSILYSEGFDEGDGGYTHSGTGDTWDHGTPSAEFTRGPSVAHSGTRCWGTNLGGDVPKESDAYLTSPDIALPALSAGEIMRLRFFGWIHVDFMHDRGMIQISSDGGANWTTHVLLLEYMQGGWQEYTFDISEYGGEIIQLRFRCFADDEDTFDPPETYNMAGLYVDDIAITVAESPPVSTELTFTAWEQASSTASCPWIFEWNGAEYVKDNDIFSTARGENGEYDDYYRLANAPYKIDDTYRLSIRETEQEESFIDFAELIVVDHGNDVIAAGDEKGNIFTYSSPAAPQSAVDAGGNDVADAVGALDGAGAQVFNNDAIELDFAGALVQKPAILVLGAMGFQVGDDGAGMPTGGRPLIEIQTHDANGAWVTRNVFYPRWRRAVNAYDLSDQFVFDRKIRLLAKSCHTGKYHVIDFVGLDTNPQAPLTVTRLSALSALQSGDLDVTAILSAVDGDRAHLATSQSIALTFGAPALQPGKARDFFIATRGYYIPNGTYFFYSWDGSGWVQRDSWTIAEEGLRTRVVDLGLWLPDPDGEYKVRIWQDYYFDPAGIDYIGLTRDGSPGTMTYATNMLYDESIYNQVSEQDGITADWDWGEPWPERARWVEAAWTGFPENDPPTTYPVTVELPGADPVFNWVYTDNEGQPQDKAEIEVWTGPAGTGNNVWDPAVLIGAATSVTYADPVLVEGATYFARVKASDGNAWGPWSESSFVYAPNHPPIVEAGPDQTVDAGDIVQFNGSFIDLDEGDTHTIAWDFGDGEGSAGTLAPQHVFVNPGPVECRNGWNIGESL